ncbi:MULTISPECIES: hypothetical protein [Thalassospira]|uniref:Uncharacterized protein n=1 Tax=Thalassospira permensis NBRC 106175 TaxID=1353532 RepID=A0ABR4TIX5_9PROT|nr:hypothetical protein [Thalassospira permensis]KEO52090.1 hypothetical protein SMB34_08225 [Thalassospira permensis NBRC 106175]
MNEYFEWNKFSDLYLEDSYVTNIIEYKDTLTFNMEFVLTERHPLYTHPLFNEKYCYHTGKIIFLGVSSIKWIRKSKKNFEDAKGELDCGNIDYLNLSAENVYKVGGDWGELEIISSEIDLTLD